MALDLFISYHRPDHNLVAAVQRLLEGRGISTFRDESDLRRGLLWSPALEAALNQCRAVAIFIGKEKGPWQHREILLAIDRQAIEEKHRYFPVIPVLLPGGTPPSGFLSLLTWVDLRDGVDNLDEIDAMAASINSGTRLPRKTEQGDVCPYQSLSSFREEDARFLFGRDEAIQRLYDKVTSGRLAAVVGSSGSGKSSVVLAGLVPRLRRERPPEVTWDIAVMTPGKSPAARLGEALIGWLEPELESTELIRRSKDLGGQFDAGTLQPVEFVDRAMRKSGADAFALVVDQFEELFTEAPTGSRKPFAGLLLNILSDRRTSIVITLRADFFGSAIDLDPDVSALIESGSVVLGPLRREELRDVIEKPAQMVGLRFDPPLLVEKLLDDVGDEPGNLPLLEYTLTELWRERTNGALRGTTYQGINGLAGAIANRAEDELNKFGNPDEVRRVMTRLVQTTDVGGRYEDTRRRANLDDFGVGERAVINEFSSPLVRLLVTGRDEVGQPTVEVAHEALIRAWGRLRGWLDQDVEFRLWRQRLDSSLEYWEKDRANVLVGPALAEAEKWLAERPANLTAPEAELISASIAKRDETRAAEATQHRRTRTLAIALGAVAVIASLAGGVAYFAQSRASQSRQAQRLSQVQTALTDPTVAALGLREVLDESQPSAEQTEAIIALLHTPLAIARARVEGRVTSITFSPNGQLVAVSVNHGGGPDHSTSIWTTSGQRQFEVSGEFMEFNKDSSAVLTSSHSEKGWIQIAGKSNPKILERQFGTIVTEAAFSFDGQSVFVALLGGSVVQVPLHSVGDAAFSRAQCPGGSDIRDEVTNIQVAADGQWIAFQSKDRVEVYRSGGGLISCLAAPGSRALTVIDPSSAVAVAPDDDVQLLQGTEAASICKDEIISGFELTTILSSPTGRQYSRGWVSALMASRGRMAWLLDVSTYAPLKCPITSLSSFTLEDGSITASAISADGDYVALAGGNAVQAWNSRGAALRKYVTGAYAVQKVAIDSSGERLVTAHSDGTLRFWDTKASIAAPLATSLSALAISSDGRLAVMAGGSKGAVVIDRAGKEMATLTHDAVVTAAAFATQNGVILTGAEDGSVVSWTPHTEDSDYTALALRPSSGVEESRVLSIVSSPKAHVALVSFATAPPRTFDLRAPKHELEFGPSSPPFTKATFFPDGQSVLTWGSGPAAVWAIAGGLRCELERSRDISNVQISPGDGHVIAATTGTRVALWDSTPTTGNVCTMRSTDQSDVRNALLDLRQALTFSPDGRYLVANNSAGDVAILNLKTATTTTLGVPERDIGEARFSQDQTRLWTASKFRAQLWTTDGRLVATLWDRSRGMFQPISANTDDILRQLVHLSPSGDVIFLRSESGPGRLWPVTREVFLERLDALTTVCLTASERKTVLVEDDTDAASRAERCENKRSSGSK